jgi:hypothetical protein
MCPDISLCHGEDCPSKNDCYRFRAEPSGHRQAWSNFDDMRQGAGRCDSFWPLDRAYTKLRPLQAQIDGGAE